MQNYSTVITAVVSVFFLAWTFVVRVATWITHLMALVLMRIVKKTSSATSKIVQQAEDMQEEEAGSLLALELDAD